MRRQLAGLALNALARWHGTLRTTTFGVSRAIPVRGTLALALVQRGGRTLSWKSAFFEAFPQDADACFIDIGTSVGQTLLEFVAAEPNGTYIGIDPNPSVIAYLNELITINGFSRCRAFCFAASDKAEPALLNLSAEDIGATGGTLIGDLRPTQNDRTIGVATLPLDTITPFLDNKRVVLVKIDVEGAELFVLRGMRQLIAQHRPVIVCEVLFADPEADPTATENRNIELAALMYEHGYKLFQIVKRSEMGTDVQIRPIDQFPRGIYNADTANLCDYLFLPDEMAVPASLPLR